MRASALVPADRVRQIDIKRIDRGRGALIGLGIGGGVGVPISLLIAAVCANETGNNCSAGFVAGIAGSAALGTGIGAAIGRGRHVEAFAAPGAQIAPAPIVTRQRKGLLFTINW